ncbi:MAG: 4'-phosphopantetheinyl transferase superfamily protein [Paludibacteraceae bacterium]|nr:4'-phosphopantetheinyl transferase superfamily protein [Paludibacteraceae bacterium]HOU68840.1 4'-phosphopantetheinyl transferase superfamily protein [Paludibacteraceae bacterium]HQF50738.1 4'-phosphopantetheinyl transferase superfamily protein [Paludibacteraceae bacterium]HQJ89362.1 4'-phosphopantetheinyl transferase superfamily protein [Paludibacteraceae bacterium]
MLISKETFQDGSILVLWKMEEDEEQLLAHFDEKREEYRCKIEQFPYPKRRLEFLTSRCVLKEITKCENGIYYNENGKPSLVDNLLKISISHTNGYLTLLAHPEKVVGIDVELKKEKIFRVKHKYLSSYELENIDPNKEMEHLLLYWSAKEAIFKMMDIRDIDFIKDLHINRFKIDKEGVMEAYETRTPANLQFKLNYRIYDDFVMVWGFI